MTTQTKPQLHPDSDLIDQFGGPTQLAKRLGMTKAGSVQRVQNWKKRGIPLAVKVEHSEIFFPNFLGMRAGSRPSDASAESGVA